MENIVANLCAKFNNHRLRNEKAIRLTTTAVLTLNLTLTFQKLMWNLAQKL